MRFHVLAVPHAITIPEYSSCAFTQKVWKLCKMLKTEGHEVLHYGHLLSKVECDENIAVVLPQELERSYPGWDWRKQSFPPFKKTDECYRQFYRRAARAIRRRFQPGDFLLCSFGDWHRDVADALKDLPIAVVESGIGYPSGSFANYRVFESYAVMHAYQGQGAIAHSTNNFWYDAVIPNFFDLTQFEYCDKKDDFFLFLGRVGAHKGVNMAIQVAEYTKTRLIIAGTGDRIHENELITCVGNVGPEERKNLLSKAKATICMSTFLEPFCGVQIESMLSGTPVISADRGAFAEYNLQGKTGYRCRSFEHIAYAVRNLDKIDPAYCREWAEQFSMENIAPRYTDYFLSVYDIAMGRGGFYAERPERTCLFG